MAIHPESDAGNQPALEETKAGAGLKFTDAFDLSGNSSAFGKPEEAPLRQIAGVGDDWKVFAGRRDLLEKSATALELPAEAKEILQEKLKEAASGARPGQKAGTLSESQTKLAAEAERVMLNPRELLQLFVGADDSEEKRSLKDTIERAFSRLGLNLEASKAERRISLKPAVDSLKLQQGRGGEALIISLKHNRIGPPSMLFEKQEARQPGPRPVDAKEPAPKVSAFKSADEGKAWLAEHLAKEAARAREAAERESERNAAEARAAQAEKEADSKRAEKAGPIIEKAVSTAVEQLGVRQVDQDKIKGLLNGLLKLDKAAVESVFKAGFDQAESGLGLSERRLLKQSLQNLGLTLDKFGSDLLALHDARNGEGARAIIIDASGTAGLGTKVKSNDVMTLDTSSSRSGESAREKKAKTADWFSDAIVKGNADLEAARTELDLQRRFGRLLLDTNTDAKLKERLAEHGVNRDRLRDLAVDYLTAQSMGKTMKQAAELDRLLRPSLPGSRLETERLYFQALLTRAGVSAQISEGARLDGGGRWLTMAVTTIDGKSFHSTGSDGVTVFGRPGADSLRSASATQAAASFRQSLELVEHKDAVLQELNEVLGKWQMQSLSEKDRKALSELVDSSAKSSWYMGSSQERRLKEKDGLIARLEERGFKVQFSEGHSQLLISAPGLKESLILNLNPADSGSKAARISLIELPEKGASSAELKIDSMPPAPEPEKLRRWLFDAEYKAKDSLISRTRELERNRAEVHRDRGDLEAGLLRRMSEFLPESGAAAESLSADEAQKIRLSAARFIASFSTQMKDGVEISQARSILPWNIIAMPVDAPARRYFDACLKLAGFSGKAILDPQKGSELKGYRLSQISAYSEAARELYVSASFLDHSAEHELKAADREGFRQTVEISLRAAESVSRAVDLLEHQGLTVGLGQRQAALSSLRQVLRFAAADSSRDGLAELAGNTAAERAILNLVLRRAGVELRLFDHAGSGFDSGTQARDLSFGFLKDGKPVALDLSVLPDPINPDAPPVLRPKNSAEFESLRRTLLENLRLSVMEARHTELPPSIPDSTSLSAARHDLAAQTKAKIEPLLKALVNSVPAEAGIQSQAIDLLKSIFDPDSARVKGPVSAQLKQVISQSLTRAGLKSAFIDSNELGLSAPGKETLDLYIWKPGSTEALLLRQSGTQFESGFELYSLPADPKTGSPELGKVTPADKPAQLLSALAENMLEKVGTPAHTQVQESAGSRELRAGSSESGDRLRVTINVTPQPASRSPFGAPKPKPPEVRTESFKQTLSERLLSYDLGLDRSKIEKGVSPSQLIVGALGELAEGKKGDISARIAEMLPWKKGSAEFADFVKEMNALGCTVVLEENLVLKQSRKKGVPDTVYDRIIVKLPEVTGLEGADKKENRFVIAINGDTRLGALPDGISPAEGAAAEPHKNSQRLNLYTAAKLESRILTSSAGPETLEGLAKGSRPSQAKYAPHWALAVLKQAIDPAPLETNQGLQLSELAIKSNAEQGRTIEFSGADIDAALKLAEARIMELKGDERTRAMAELKRLQNLLSLDQKSASADPGQREQALARLAAELQSRAAGLSLEKGRGIGTGITILLASLLAMAGAASAQTRAPIRVQH